MQSSDGHVERVRSRISHVVLDRAYELVTAYYSPSSGFAGVMFDGLGTNHFSEFTSDDLVAASLLDVKFGPAAVHEILVEGSANALLREIPNSPDTALWNTDLSRDSAPWKLWTLLMNIDGIGATRASKLMARKRPHLLPILDSVIIAKLGLGRRDQWKTLGAALDDKTRTSIDQLSEAVPGNPPSTLRLLDVAAWMRFSESDPARAVRKQLGFNVPERTSKTAESASQRDPAVAD